MKEKGFAQIKNEILEALARIKLSPYESKYIFALLRKTRGWQKDFDFIANSQFAKITGIRREHICRTEVKLLGRKIITCRGKKIGINLSFDQWKELPAEVIITRRGKAIAYKGNKKLPSLVATKESKETIQKKGIFSLPLEETLKMLEDFKQGDNTYKPLFQGDTMVWKKLDQKFYVINKHGQWLPFVGKNNDIQRIEWRRVKRYFPSPTS